MTTYEIESVIRNGDEYCLGGGGGGGGIKMVDVLVLGGGGGGGGGGCSTCSSSGGCATGGGGGAGQLKIIEGVALRNNVFPVVVGNRGMGGLATRQGQNGFASKFGNIVAIGGGGGGAGGRGKTCNCLCSNGLNGGNGGGAGGTRSKKDWVCGIGGASTVGGHAGGVANEGRYTQQTCSQYSGGGGGGVGGDGGNGVDSSCAYGIKSMHVGGRGILTCFGGTLRCLGGGGTAPTYLGANYIYTVCDSGACCVSGYDYTYNGHRFGGGIGSNKNGCNGCANTGGGGGGGYRCKAGGSGGSGLVIVRYPTDGSYGINSATGGNTCRTCTIDGVEYKIHEFTSNGTFCITG